MPRNSEDARRRLRQATLELFLERGYDATTTAEIAARAGVTERTFFRRFPDKREALFDGEEAFRDTLTNTVLEAPQDLDPMEVLRRAFCAVERMIVDNRAFAEPREAVIARTPALQERVLTKTAGLIGALSTALRSRGVDENVAGLAAQVGMAAFRYATRAWAADPAAGLDAHLTGAFDKLQGLTSTRRKSRSKVG
jgi:AcrR family transcriptional regulator